MYYESELSDVCGYTRVLDLTFYEKKILHFYGYWKTILFRWLRVTPILVYHETNCIGKIIYLSLHAYKERSSQRSFMSYVLIWKQGIPDSELKINMKSK
jgi:hypothetical protein